MVNRAAALRILVFPALVWALMTFEDPFRIALCAAMLSFMDPVRRWILSLAPAKPVTQEVVLREW
jgi:hypothetical protein